MATTIVYYVHGTTPYNERGIASGQSRIGLSQQGIWDAKKLAHLTEGLFFDAIFTSDLPRAVQTAELAFGMRYLLVHEPRLREIDDGHLTGQPLKSAPAPQTAFVDTPYPGGESFKDVEVRIQSLLSDVREKYGGKRVAFMAHQAPQLALEVLLKGMTWEDTFKNDWRKTKAWQPGWEYVLP